MEKPVMALAAFSVLLLAFGCIGNQGAPSAGECINYSVYGQGLGFDTSKLAGFQDDVFSCMRENKSLNGSRALSMLGSFLLSYSTGIPQIDRFNPVLSNNLAIRSDAVRMLLMRRLNSSYVPDFSTLIAKLRTYGFESNGYITWYEGSGYLVYTLGAIHELNVAYGNIILSDFEAKSRRWLNGFSLPNGELAPIGDTPIGSKYAEPKESEGLVYTKHETALFFGSGSGYLLIRHPVANANGATEIRNDLHTSFDVGAVYLWYNGSWKIRPVGYPGYPAKVGERLGTKYDWNIQSADNIGNDFEQWDLNSGNIPAYLSSWRYGTVAEFPNDYISRTEYPDRYEIALKYRLNTGKGGAFEDYERNVTVFKGNKTIEITDYCGCNGSSSYLLVSDDVSVASNSTVSYGYGRWSPAWGQVEQSKRINISGNGAIYYTVGWD
jgi:hypothetical protein